MIRIRPAREDDSDALAQVWFEAYYAMYDEAPAPEPGLRARLHQRITEELAGGDWRLFAADDEGRVAALLALRPADGSLDQIFVANGYRSRGIGRHLLDFVKREFPCGFWLRTHVDNAKAQRFYASQDMVHTHDAPHPRHPEAMFRNYAWDPASRAVATGIAIRVARPQDFDAIARVWQDSFESTGLVDTVSIDALRARIPVEVEKGWSLFAADQDGQLAAMLAIDVADRHLDQIFVAPTFQSRGIGKLLLTYTRQILTDEIWLRAAVANTRATQWYEHEGFVKERIETRPEWSGARAYYRWKRQAAEKAETA